jgi:hypothetical protein
MTRIPLLSYPIPHGESDPLQSRQLTAFCSRFICAVPLRSNSELVNLLSQAARQALRAAHLSAKFPSPLTIVVFLIFSCGGGPRARASCDCPRSPPGLGCLAAPAVVGLADVATSMLCGLSRATASLMRRHSGGDWLLKTFWSGMEGWYRLISLGHNDTRCLVWLHFIFSSRTNDTMIGLLPERFWCMISMHSSWLIVRMDTGASTHVPNWWSYHHFMHDLVEMIKYRYMWHSYKYLGT